ncbi:9d70928c-7c54-4456-962c-fb050098c303 [Sclerotinia trifoliorum]|uniref:9d70928c-7c54-4456-962c-fb050098c303 n=1 Tax=Sclerotinia trifoliorum TaxID=28548 RepID=A0A8H2W5H1_9HELO|nr:9d70928c-7c54-4456-962c-fb050098c303 [Sclerotinia trifoliorum]
MGPRASACHMCGSGSSCYCHRPFYWDRTHPEPPNFPVAPGAECVQSCPGTSNHLQFSGQNTAQPSESTAPNEPLATDEFNDVRIPRGTPSAHSTPQQSSTFTNTPSESRSTAAPTSDSSPATSNNSFENSAHSASTLDSNNYFTTKRPRSSPVDSESIGTQLRVPGPLPPVDNTSPLWAPKPLRVTKNITQFWTESEASTNNPALNNAQQSRKRTLTDTSHYGKEEEQYQKKYKGD